MGTGILITGVALVTVVGLQGVGAALSRRARSRDPRVRRLQRH